VVYSHRPSTLAEWWKNELRWRRLHLRSLFRLRDIWQDDPIAAARHLYPYTVAWGMAALTAGAAVGIVAAPRPLRSGLLLSWAGALVWQLVRDLAGVFETAAYTAQPGWLRLIPVVPVLTVAGWLAGCRATLTVHRASLQFKGPRQPAAPK
jgi:hypothetical protein